MAAQWHKQIDVAQCQLDQAITLFLDGKDYYSSRTLAGDGEEIFGKLTESSGNTHALNKMEKDICSTITDEELDAIGKQKGLISLLNEYRNWLKHYVPEGNIFIEAEDSAYELIDRTIENCIAVTGMKSDKMVKYRIYLSERYA